MVGVSSMPRRQFHHGTDRPILGDMEDGPEDSALLRAQLAALEEQSRALKRRIERLEPPAVRPSTSISPAEVTAASPSSEKVNLFRKLFSGRTDVFPVRWENSGTGRSGYAPACRNEWVRGVCDKPRVKCGECPNQAFIPISDVIIASHLRGKAAAGRVNAPYVCGVYPLLANDTCWFLAVDFDGEEWSADALAFFETCRVNGVPVAIERSRSGEGGHVWIFFSQPVPAREARLLGASLLTQTMERRPEIGFPSYDRMFPSQDVMPRGGFGNLIALPLQRPAREYGNSVFVDERLQPFADQWAFLASLPRLSPREVNALVNDAQTKDRVLGVRMPLEDDDGDEPWCRPPSRQKIPALLADPLPDRLRITLADGIYVDRLALPPSMVARMVRLAAFQNPEFYRAQAMRLTTYDKPRIVSCASLHRRHVELPRGCLEEVLELMKAHGVRVDVDDQRDLGVAVACQFTGILRPEQQFAVGALVPHDCGVLAATTAFGKTVVAAAMIAYRQRSTLVLVHRRELLTQWVERLKQFLSIDADQIGVIGGGKRKPTGSIDVAVIQSLVRKGEVSDLIAGYGHLIVDECHHLSAASFELVARRSKARYVLGLSATVTRKDGHHPIIHMQCGPVRHRVSAKLQAAQRAFEHRVRMRSTEFVLPGTMDGHRVSMPALYAALAQDEARNAAIFDDVLASLEAGRCPLILTGRRDHLELLQGRFALFTRNLIVLHGGLSTAQRRVAKEALQASSEGERLVLATGQFLGEGFDDPRFDTLFLLMPISWKGTLAQYVGRLHRDHDSKREVIVYDYVDSAVPVLARMAAKRATGYRALGYAIE
ncbi:MAG: DEAD/DEAH box helicase family protein [Steroidobacteraceae bacterium]